MGKSVLVVGGSLAGIRSALAESKKGNKVYLLESSPGLSRDGFFQNGSEADILLEQIRQDKNIRIITNASLERVESGNGFKITVKQQATRVNQEKCDDCRDCLRVCPVHTLNNGADGLSLRTAIDFSDPKIALYDILREERPVCQETCPAGLDIRGYISLISEGKFPEAIALIRQVTPFVGVLGYICTHPCEAMCNRGYADEPLAIRSLKRFLADWERNQGGRPVLPVRQSARSERVAVIGAGPAGLNCAYDLARKGYPVTVFESLPVAGGMLYVGVPEYRLPRDVLAIDIESVKMLDLDIRLNTAISKELTLDSLFKDGFKAIFIGVGAHQNQRLDIHGEASDGVIPGVNFLRDLNLKRGAKIGKRVAVIGGGNVAMDSARSAVRLGANEVMIIYRRTKAEMPASIEEIEAAEKEGVEFHYLAAPVEVVSDKGKVRGIRCIQMQLGEMDASGRRKPVPVKGSEFDIEADMVIPAIGQKVDTAFLDGQSAIEITRAGTIATASNLQTARPGVFAGGDAVTGPNVVVQAIAMAKKAAKSIDEYLRGN